MQNWLFNFQFCHFSPLIFNCCQFGTPLNTSYVLPLIELKWRCFGSFFFLKKKLSKFKEERKKKFRKTRSDRKRWCTWRFTRGTRWRSCSTVGRPVPGSVTPFPFLLVSSSPPYQYLEDKCVRFKLVSAAKASNHPKPQIEDPLLQQGDGKTVGSKWSAAMFARAALFTLTPGSDAYACYHE